MYSDIPNAIFYPGIILYILSIVGILYKGFNSTYNGRIDVEDIAMIFGAIFWICVGWLPPMVVVMSIVSLVVIPIGSLVLLFLWIKTKRNPFKILGML